MITGIHDKESDRADFQIIVTAPSIYLDQCAIQHFASNANDRVSFLSALREKNGTVYFSTLNLMEIMVLDTLGPRYGSFKDFIDGIGDQFALIESVPESVIAKEDGKKTAVFPENVTGNLPPPVDDRLIVELFRSADVNKISFTALMRASEDDSDRLRKLHAEAKKRIKATTDEVLKRKSPFAIPPYKGGAPTRQIFSHVANMLIESKEEFSENDSIDLFHAIVPTAYAFFVVLDNKWGRRMQQMNIYGSATIFKLSEMNKFMDALNSFK